LRSRRFATRKAGFLHEVISPTEGGFLPQEADLVEKAHIVLVDECVLFPVAGVGLEPHVLAKFSAENLASVTSRL
jgi:hypothetical protein